MILITGGQRSGKSSFAQSYCETHFTDYTYLATCLPLDTELDLRVKKHQQDRSEKWKLIEEGYQISDIHFSEGVTLIDCITLWLTNLFMKYNEDIDMCLSYAKNEILQIQQTHKSIVWVTNEIGLGVIPIHASTRKFCDLQGWVNQFVATQCSEVYFMVSGIPTKIK